MNLGSASVIRGNARSLPLADNSVDLVVTSPPYFALRSYQDGGEHYAGQIGDEPTPAAFVASLLEVTRECVRVLKPSGSLWVNLGDKYAASHASVSNNGTGSSGLTGGVPLRDREAAGLPRRIASGVPTKSLIGIPWRYALACIDDLGLILRAEVIWSKPNGLPESVTDRVRRSHEQWFHFTLSPRYFSAVDEIREPHAEVSLRRAQPHRADPGRAHREDLVYGGQMPAQTLNLANMNHPLGKLPGSVWTVPTEPLKVPDHLGVDHFAAFPTEWPKRIIRGWSPAGVCVACGEGRRPIVRADYDNQGRTTNGPKNEARKALTSGPDSVAMIRNGVRAVRETTITGYACACPTLTAATRPAVILDPFGGTGTTALVAKALGRDGVSVDMSADYCRLATWRTRDRNQLARVLDLPKAEAQPDNQASLF